jgi:hypothetical protein
MDATPPPRRGRKPNPNGPTPTRSLRIGADWDAAVAIAAERGENVNKLVAAYLHRYVQRHTKA